MAKGKKTAAGSGDLFIEASGQMRLADKSAEQRAIENRKVECLGMTFENDEARRAYFIEKLRERLKDPEFRKIEGFPLGEDEDILALSDPPHYTACPNPFLSPAVATTDRDRPSDTYSRDPFAADISEGKSDPLYLAHSYHTKVPPRAIARYLLWFTSPGDIVLDAYCGSGMTGVAARLCEDPPEDFRATVEHEWRAINESKPQWGPRRAILCDLSPAATFIASNHVSDEAPGPVVGQLESALAEVERSYGDLYRTRHNGWSAGERNPKKWVNTPKSSGTGEIAFVIWSEILSCPECAADINLWADGIDVDAAAVANPVRCPKCGAEHPKAGLDRSAETVWDEILKTSRVINKFVPVFIVYDVGSKRFEKLPDAEDLAVIKRASALRPAGTFPAMRMMNSHGSDGAWGTMYRAGYHRGVSHVHHFFTDRNWLILTGLWNAVRSPGARFVLTSLLNRMSRMHSLHMKYFFKGGGGFAAGNRKGQLYFPSIFLELSPFKYLPERTTTALAAFGESSHTCRSRPFISTGSAERLPLPECSVDYVFIDPPFGQNLIYSELNFLWEAWLRVVTSVDAEAIIDDFRRKGMKEYQEAMRRGFSEAYRVLKHGRWMTVEFHNSQNAVWIAIQEALQAAGFVVADVRTLDKKQKTVKQAMTAGAVKQDLVISAYKPNGGLEQQFRLHAGTPEGAWDFLRQHLKHLPGFVEAKGSAEAIAERQPFLLFDRMVAFHIQRGATVPMGAAEFYAGIKQRFPERDGMYFLPEQVAEYDRRRLQVREITQLECFVSDERSALQWLRLQLDRDPQTYQQIQPKFLKELHQADHEQLPELRELLQQNFLEDQKHRWYVPDPNKQLDLEKLRDKALLREFEEYKTLKLKRLKVFRAEAVRSGFKAAWAARDYETIVSVAQKLPEDVLREDLTILQYYDNASMRIGS